MPITDLDAMVRDRAYALWEAAGRPHGHEHQHWAEASQLVAAEMTPHAPVASPADAQVEPVSWEVVDIRRLREALYRPEPFSFDLFGRECPAVTCPAVLFADERHAA